jgi:hypothetical protein
MTFRSDLDALEARHAALEAEVTRRSDERDRTCALLEDARARARLPVLDNVSVAAPCTASWDAMTGNERVRHCATCNKDVYNLSSMTRDEAEALLVETRGELCGRYYRRADGTILTSDCGVGVTRQRRRRLAVLGAAAAVAATVVPAAYLLVHTDERRADLTMGSIAISAPTVTPPTVAPPTPEPPPPPPKVLMGKIGFAHPETPTVEVATAPHASHSSPHPAQASHAKPAAK